MFSSQARFFVPFSHFGLLLFFAGLLTGGVFFFLDAPVWAYYLAPILGLPIFLWGLVIHDRAEEGRPAPEFRLRPDVLASDLSRVVVLEARYSWRSGWELGLVRFLLVGILSVVSVTGGIGVLTFLVRAFADGAFIPSLITLIALAAISITAFLLRTRQVHRIRQHKHLGHSRQGP